MVTPLTEDDKIDVESLKRLTDHCINNGMHCLYPCGTTGEMMYLTVEERKQVAEVVVKHAAGKIPVFVHVGAWNQKDTIELAKHAVEIGADGIGVVTPPFYKISDDGLVDFYTAVAQSVPADFPVYLYGIPQNAINDLSAYVCQKVAEKCPNVVGAKYSFPDMTRLQQLMTVNDGKFSVLVGPDHLFEAVVAVGGEGVVSGNAMCIPEHYAAVWDAMQKGDFKLATKLQRRTNILNATMCAINNSAAYEVILKYEECPEWDSLTSTQEKALLARMKELNYRTVEV